MGPPFTRLKINVDVVVAENDGYQEICYSVDCNQSPTLSSTCSGQSSQAGIEKIKMADLPA